jgi:hypothetical protein
MLYCNVEVFLKNKSAVNTLSNDFTIRKQIFNTLSFLMIIKGELKFNDLS